MEAQARGVCCTMMCPMARRALRGGMLLVGYRGGGKDRMAFMYFNLQIKPMAPFYGLSKQMISMDCIRDLGTKYLGLNKIQRL